MKRVRPLRGGWGGGIVSLEFALVAPVFLLFVGMIMQTGLTIFTQAVLDNATRSAARLIRTGEIQGTGTAALTAFTTALCSTLSAPIACASVQLDVRSASGFSQITPVTIASGGSLAATGFSPGGPGSDVLVTVGYDVPALVPWLGTLWTGALVVSTDAFTNESW